MMKKKKSNLQKISIIIKKYALFAEILNDSENSQTKLIKVDLNNYETQRIGGGIRFGRGFKPLMFNMAAPKSFRVVGCTRPMMMCGAAMLMMKKMTMPNKMMTRAVPKSSLNKMCAAQMNNINMNFNINSNSGIKRKEDNNEIKDDLTRLIMSQDIIGGSWNENRETKN